jgi:hypothetical protein
MAAAARTRVSTLEGVEKRAVTRYSLGAAVAVLPLNGVLLPAREPFLTVARDISTQGIGLLHFQAITEPYLAVDLQPGSGKQMQVIVHVRRCRPRGSFFDVAGEMLTKTAVSV